MGKGSERTLTQRHGGGYKKWSQSNVRTNRQISSIRTYFLACGEFRRVQGTAETPSPQRTCRELNGSEPEIRALPPQSLAVFFHFRYSRLAFNALSVANDHLSRRMRPTLKGY
jgi:hypothetical protein